MSMQEVLDWDQRRIAERIASLSLLPKQCGRERERRSTDANEYAVAKWSRHHIGTFDNRHDNLKEQRMRPHRLSILYLLGRSCLITDQHRR